MSRTLLGEVWVMKEERLAQECTAIQRNALHQLFLYGDKRWQQLMLQDRELWLVGV